MNAMAQEVAQTMIDGVVYTKNTLKLKCFYSFHHNVCIKSINHKVMSLAVIGVPTAATLQANAILKQNKTSLELLLNIQKSLDEFKDKVAEMDEEMRTVKLENTILKNKINELTSSSSSAKSSPPSRRGFFGYGADEF